MSLRKLVYMLLLLQKKFNTNVSHFFQKRFVLCNFCFVLCICLFLFRNILTKGYTFSGRVMVDEFAQVGIYAFGIAKKIE